MRIIFMGTPDFAVPALRAAFESSHEVLLAVTQPDRPKGRHGAAVFSPVKEEALRLGVPVFQPVKLREKEAVQRLKDEKPDLIVVAAYGQILPEEVLSIPVHGCINIHASLLPKYRGAAPIQQAILDGEQLSGITIMQMDKGLDTGDILLQSEVEIAPDETGGSLFNKLSEEGAALLVKALEQIAKGGLKAVPQDEAAATYVKMLDKESGKLDFSLPAEYLERFVRAMDPWPGAYTFLEGKMLKVWKAAVLEEGGGEEGVVAGAGKDGIAVSCGKGALVLKEVQLSGRKRMNVRDFLLGMKVTPGTVLG